MLGQRVLIIFVLIICISSRVGQREGEVPWHIEKLSGDNTREEKERVMVALRTG